MKVENFKKLTNSKEGRIKRENESEKRKEEETAWYRVGDSLSNTSAITFNVNVQDTPVNTAVLRLVKTNNQKPYAVIETYLKHDN